MESCSSRASSERSSPTAASRSSAEEQSNLADQALLQPHRHAHQTLIPGLGAVPHGQGVVAVDGDDAGARVGLEVAAGAGTSDQAALFFQHLGWQGVGGEHQIALVGVVDQAA